jgi:5-methylcytosine-specific restriction endonuclease McrA
MFERIAEDAPVDVSVSEQPSVWQLVNQEFACDHPEVRLTKFTKSNATVEFRRQCQACGAAVGCIKKTMITPEQMRAGIPDFDKTIIERRNLARSQRFAELHAEREEDRLQDEEERFRERREQYQAYLRSPAWARRRQLVMEREEGLCQGCRRSRAVEVHHRNYDHIGDELLFDLVALCSACHRKVHGGDE